MTRTGIGSGTLDAYSVTYGQGYRSRPLFRRIREKADIPAFSGKIMNNLSLPLKVCPIDHLGQVIHEPLVIDLLMKVARIGVKCHLKTTRGMAVSEIQVLVGPDWILTLW